MTWIVFQSTPSAWRETQSLYILYTGLCISIHSLRMEGDDPETFTTFPIMGISIHSLRMEGDGRSHPANWEPTSFQSTPSAWRETCGEAGECVDLVKISIHSLRMEGDPLSLILLIVQLVISIHSLRMEGDSAKSVLHCPFRRFQSTPSAWRETYNIYYYLFYSIFQSTPSAWRETRPPPFFLSRLFPFQSTPSAWRETGSSTVARQVHSISIHSLRMEGDHCVVVLYICTIHISIHSLRMEGDEGTSTRNYRNPGFQSTPSAWRETICGCNENQFTGISIHSLRMEGDPSISRCLLVPRHFNPLPPHGGRQ